jgi:hypothetical protein
VTDEFDPADHPSEAESIGGEMLLASMMLGFSASGLLSIAASTMVGIGAMEVFDLSKFNAQILSLSGISLAWLLILLRVRYTEEP